MKQLQGTHASGELAEPAFDWLAEQVLLESLASPAAFATPAASPATLAFPPSASTGETSTGSSETPPSVPTSGATCETVDDRAATSACTVQRLGQLAREVFLNQAAEFPSPQVMAALDGCLVRAEHPSSAPTAIRPAARLALALARQTVEAFSQGDAASRGRADRWVEELATAPAGCDDHPSRLAATAAFLLALSCQTRTLFTVGGDPFPTEINPDDGRWRRVEDWSRSLPPGARVADLGCGAGRYLRRLAELRPDLHLTGIDLLPPPPDVLRAPAGSNIEIRRGCLLQIPAERQAFDAVLCIEALEHALAPRRAVAELCRVVRSGGSILIIDKDRRRQALSHHQPWERWFEPEEVAHWLRPACRRVEVQPVLHRPQARRAPLFLAWEGDRV